MSARRLYSRVFAYLYKPLRRLYMFHILHTDFVSALGSWTRTPVRVCTVYSPKLAWFLQGTKNSGVRFIVVAELLLRLL